MTMSRTSAEIIHAQRRAVLKGLTSENIKNIIRSAIAEAVERFTKNEQNTDEDYRSLANYMAVLVAQKKPTAIDELKAMSVEALKDYYTELAKTKYREKEDKYPEQIRELERVVLLRVVDNKWMDHIDNMDHLKRGSVRAYKQQIPSRLPV